MTNNEVWFDEIRKEQIERGKQGLCMSYRCATKAVIRMLSKNGETQPEYYMYCQGHWQFLMTYNEKGTKFEIELL